jgi:hypothetical protein
MLKAQGDSNLKLLRPALVTDLSPEACRVSPSYSPDHCLLLVLGVLRKAQADQYTGEQTALSPKITGIGMLLIHPYDLF